MDLVKIGDQNVEFFKGRPTFFCATKSVKPFKSYDHSKIGKGEKEHKNRKNLIFTHVNMSLTLFLVFFSSWYLPCWVGYFPVSLNSLIWVKKALKVAKMGKIEKWPHFSSKLLLCLCLLAHIPQSSLNKGEIDEKKIHLRSYWLSVGQKVVKISKIEKKLD